MMKYYSDTNIVNEKKEITYSDCILYLNTLKSAYPELIEICNAGFSVYKRLLPFAKIGNGENYIFLCGTHHAREYISSTYLLKIIEEYLYCTHNEVMYEGYNLNTLFEKCTLIIMPMVDPDGVFICQLSQTQGEELLNKRNIALIQQDIRCYKANGVGVDLNRQYPALWSLKENEIDYPASERYKGKAPATQPEVQSVMKLCKKQNFTFALTFHSKGEVIYWADSNTGTDIKYAKELTHAIADVSGYQIMPPSSDPEYYAAGFENWFRQEFLKPGILIELTPSDETCVPHDDNDFYNLVWQKACTIPAEIMQFAIDKL